MHLRPVLGLTLSVLIIVPATALAGSLRALTSGYIFDVSRSSFIDSEVSGDNATTGPVASSIDIGILVDAGPDGNDGMYEYILSSFASARVDYGLNGASAGSELLYSGDVGPPPYNPLYAPTFEPTPVNNLIAESEWRDGFVIMGGTGFDTMSVTIDLSGQFLTGNTEQGGLFDLWNAQRSGTVSYSLGYQDFYHAGGETGFEQSVIAWYQETSFDRSYQETVVGTFSFEYGIPFELVSGLSVFSAGNEVSDFLDTASLTHFTLPAGATLVADSGSYAVVPEPAGAWLVGLTLAALAARRRFSSI